MIIMPFLFAGTLAGKNSVRLMSNSTPPPLPGVQQNQPHSEVPKNFDRDHYNHLISYIKWMLGFAGVVITAILGIITYSTYASVQDYKKDVKETMTEIKDALKETKAEYLNTLKDIKKDASTQVDNLEQQVKEEIPGIKESAENLAMTSVRKTLTEQFEERNIRALISQTADEQLQGQVGLIFEQKIKQRTREIDDQTTAVANLSVAIDRITSRERKWLDTLMSIQQYHRLQIIRNLASTLMQQKINDFKIRFKYDQNLNSHDTVVWIPISHSGNKKINSVDSLVRVLVKDISTQEDLIDIACDFITLSKISGKAFDLYDFASVSKWFKSEYPNAAKKTENQFFERHFYLGYGLGYEMTGPILEIIRYPEIR